MKNLLQKGTALHMAAAILAIAAAVVYALAQARENSPVIIGLMLVAAALELFVAVAKKNIPYLEYLPFLCSLVSIAIFVDLAFDEVGDVLSKINMDGLSVSWIASAILLVITVLTIAVSTVLTTKD